MNITECIAKFVVDTRYEDIPQEVLEISKRQLLDVLGVALAGCQQPLGIIMKDYVTKIGGEPLSSLIGYGIRTSPPTAALANGAFCHALDFDDTWLPVNHPTTPVTCAILALGENNGTSGREILTSLVLGCEVIGKVATAVSSYIKGWHSVSLFGGLGAAAASAKVLGLDVDRLRMTLGISASMAGGLMANLGTMTKALHAGNAASSGVSAAMLAQEGFTANASILETFRGFYNVFYSDNTYDLWKATVALGNPYHVISPGIGIKMYPSGWLMHHTFEAALKIVEEHNITPDQVDEIEIGLHHERHFNLPQIVSGLAGKFSMQYHAVMAVLDRSLGIDSFSDERALSTDVQDMLKLVRIKVDPSLPSNFDIIYNPVTIKLKDGRSFTDQVALPKSHWRYPLKRDDWLGKFRDNASRLLPQDKVERIIELVDNLEEMEDIRQLTEVLWREKE